MARRKTDKLYVDEKVHVRSGTLPVDVGDPSGYDLRGKTGTVVRDEEDRPGVDDYGKPSGKTEPHVMIQLDGPSGRPGALVDVPSRRLARGNAVGFFSNTGGSIAAALDALNPFSKSRKRDPGPGEEEERAPVTEPEKARQEELVE